MQASQIYATEEGGGFEVEQFAYLYPLQGQSSVYLRRPPLPLVCDFIGIDSWHLYETKDYVRLLKHHHKFIGRIFTS